MKCDFHDSHDLAADLPTGNRCEAPATHRIEWSDGRHSFGCGDHLTIDEASTVKPIRTMPLVPSDFDSLRSMTCAQLAALDCRPWDESGLMLFPARWFDAIPEGFIVRTILDREVPFSRSMSADRRYGMLAFGIVPP